MVQHLYLLWRIKLLKKQTNKQSRRRQLTTYSLPTACMIFWKHCSLLFPCLDAPKHTEIRMSAEVQQDDGRSSVTLTCGAHSYPPVQRFSWYKRAKGQERDVKMSDNKMFTVFSDQPGVYYCIAKNEINERRSGPITLFVSGECCLVHLSSVEPPNLFASLSENCVFVHHAGGFIKFLLFLIILPVIAFIVFAYR